ALERAYRTVELVIDLQRLEALSEQTGVPVPDILARWRELGVTGLAVDDPDGALLAVETGLRVVPRNLEVAELARSAGWDTGPAVFTGDRVGGYPDRLEAAAGLLRDLGSPLGLIEFANQHGAPELARLLGFRVVRVHSITLEELARMADATAAARFARAARERNARVLYVRPLVRGPVEEMLARNEAYLRDIVARLAEAGLAPGPVPAPPFWRTSAVVPVAAGMAAAAGAVLLLNRLVPLGVWPAALVLAASAGLVYGLLRMGQTILARQAAALAVALVFPALAVLSATDRLRDPTGAERRRAPAHRAADLAARAEGACGGLGGAGGPGGAGRGSGGAGGGPAGAGGWALAVAQFVAITGAGALLVAAALGDTRFLVQLEQFRGVKLAHVAPLAVVAVFWAVDQSRGSWTRWLFAPVRVWHVLAAAAVLLLGYIYVGRTGNDLVPVLQLEQWLRVGLEDALTVRPRTKEFLLGYPAALLGFGLWAAGRRALAWPLLVVGTVASISMINTFAHAHAPLAVSAVRSVYGLAAGTLVAGVVAVAFTVVRRLPPVQRLMTVVSHAASSASAGGGTLAAGGTREIAR
ncbi:MAG TPA: DUF5693 family protein, partial [Limnochordales bacterium]